MAGTPPGEGNRGTVHSDDDPRGRSEAGIASGAEPRHRSRYRFFYRPPNADIVFGSDYDTEAIGQALRHDSGLSFKEWVDAVIENIELFKMPTDLLVGLLPHFAMHICNPCLRCNEEIVRHILDKVRQRYKCMTVGSKGWNSVACYSCVKGSNSCHIKSSKLWQSTVSKQISPKAHEAFDLYNYGCKDNDEEEDEKNSEEQREEDEDEDREIPKNPATDEELQVANEGERECKKPRPLE
ncbi:hypothetical protein ACP70R_033852 [Stipagrostis hirtigluma subsp. patula]